MLGNFAHNSHCQRNGKNRHLYNPRVHPISGNYLPDLACLSIATRLLVPKTQLLLALLGQISHRFILIFATHEHPSHGCAREPFQTTEEDNLISDATFDY